MQTKDAKKKLVQRLNSQQAEHDARTEAAYEKTKRCRAAVVAASAQKQASHRKALDKSRSTIEQKFEQITQLKTEKSDLAKRNTDLRTQVQELTTKLKLAHEKRSSSSRANWTARPEPHG